MNSQTSSRPCDACTAPTPSGTLQLTELGQFLCRQCYGKYLSMRATAQQRASEAHRRCGNCGTVLLPTAQHDRLQRRSQWQITIGAGDNDSFPVLTIPSPFSKRRPEREPVYFSGEAYQCDRCGVRFKTFSALVAAIVATVAAGGACGLYVSYDRGDLKGQLFGWAIAIPCTALLLWDVYLRLRHRRIR